MRPTTGSGWRFRRGFTRSGWSRPTAPGRGRRRTGRESTPAAPHGSATDPAPGMAYTNGGSEADDFSERGSHPGAAAPNRRTAMTTPHTHGEHEHGPNCGHTGVKHDG